MSSSTHLYLDSGDPAHTRELLQKQVLLAGQTTNPSLVAKHPEVVRRIESGQLFSKSEIYELYKSSVQEIASLVTESVSIEVYADYSTTPEEMVAEGLEMNGWIPNAHIKLPIIPAGLQAASQLVKKGVRVNMTLCFSQAHAAAVYSATQGAETGQVLISPFVGRLDDSGVDGMSGVRNIQRMYAEGDGHVQILAASLRSQDHLLACYQDGVDIITAPYELLRTWSEVNFPLPTEDFVYTPDLPAMPYEEMDLTAAWDTFNIEHELVRVGVERFASDWNALLRADN